MVGICRHAGFEPKLRGESFHTGWDLLLLTVIRARQADPIPYRRP
jgi:hypothetical protein